MVSEQNAVPKLVFGGFAVTEAYLLQGKTKTGSPVSRVPSYLSRKLLAEAPCQRDAHPLELVNMFGQSVIERLSSAALYIA